MMVCAAVGIGVNLEGGIFLRQSAERHAHLFLVGLGLGLDRDRNHRHRERDRLERNRMPLVADRVARADVLQSNHGADVARENLLDIFALVGVHLEQTPDALRLLRARDQHRLARLQLARIHANEGQLADERIGHDLERQRRERLLVVRFARNRLTVSGLMPLVSGVSSGEGRKSTTASSSG